MTVYYRRRPPELRENLGAGLVALAAAAGVAAVTFYVTRLLMVREPLSSIPPYTDPEEEAASASLPRTSGEG